MQLIDHLQSRRMLQHGLLEREEAQEVFRELQSSKHLKHALFQLQLQAIWPAWGAVRLLLAPQQMTSLVGFHLSCCQRGMSSGQSAVKPS